MYRFVAVAALLTAPALAQDIENGETLFQRGCRSCHMIEGPDGVIVRGGQTGPNLYGIVGRTAGSADFPRYGDDLVAVGEAGFVWTEDEIATYIENPGAWLEDKLGGSARSLMAYRQRQDQGDIAAYLATFSE